MSLSKRTSQPLSGEKDARDFDSLFQEHWERVCRVLYRLLGDWDEAQDLAMESFLQLYHHPQETLANPGGWLYRVSTRLGLNALRARKRRDYYEAQAGREFPATRPGRKPGAARRKRPAAEPGAGRIETHAAAFEPAFAAALFGFFLRRNRRHPGAFARLDRQPAGPRRKGI